MFHAGGFASFAKCLRRRLQPCSSRRASTQPVQSLTFPEIDKKWRARWAFRGLLKKKDPPKETSFILAMFVYASGQLHTGHLRVYTISDVIARFNRMRGYNVVHPTGWDAFGLPAENAAIERGIDPAEWTRNNISTMKEQLIGMNTSFDWDREINTCSPDFYKHTQRIFLMLHKRGLAYQADALVNFDPVDKTVLANEQVDSSGRSWRSGALVQQINLRQWFFRITAFKDALLDDLSELRKDNKWPDRIIAQQRNWLGKSKGASIKFMIKQESSDTSSDTTYVTVFTTRPDTLFGVKYVALSLTHPLVVQLAQDDSKLQSFLNKSASSPDSKLGYVLPKILAVNPLTHLGHGDGLGLPVFAAPYVLDDYGEGAVMGVPGHDTRDLDFWRQHCPEEPVPIVVYPESHSVDFNFKACQVEEAITEPGVLTPLCGPYSGIESRVAGSKIVEDLAARSLASATVNWRLRDWLISRQRYWGTPIPIIHCQECGPVPVPDADLPVCLPQLDQAHWGMKGNPLENMESWVNTQCPSCQRPARRETDTMDTFVDSSWYFLRFLDPKNKLQPFSPESARAVDIYLGGSEHAVLHLLYARFIYKFLQSEGFIKTAGNTEPFQKLIAQGMVLGKTFSDPATGKFLQPDEMQSTEDGHMILKATGQAPVVTWEKMSKSKFNGVNPTDSFAKYGSDVIRAHILFAAPVGEDLQWDEEKIVGMQRWFQRILRLISQFKSITRESLVESVAQADAGKGSAFVATLNDADVEVFLLTQRTIKAVTHTLTDDIYSLNTTVSNLIKLTNGLVSADASTLTPWVAYNCTSALVRMLAPIAPAFAEQCWEDFHYSISKAPKFGSVLDSSWPVYALNPKLEFQLLKRQKTMTCAVQINGKLRFTAEVPTRTLDMETLAEKENALIDHILATTEGKHWLVEKNDWEKRKRVVVVGSGKLVNIVF